jgi:hypothetical protein
LLFFLAAVVGTTVVVVVVLDGGRDDGQARRQSVGTHYADIKLDAVGRRALQILVNGYAGMVTGELEQLAPELPIAAIALDPGQEGLDVTPNISLATESELERLFRQDPEFGSTYVWNAWDYGRTLEPSFAEPPHENGPGLGGTCGAAGWEGH